MITVEQIKAARALLDWSQDDLAEKSGISKAALTNLERRASSPRKETLLTIQTTLEQAGIEFTEGPGVKLTGDILKIQVFKGEDSIQRLWNDIYDSLKPGEARLIYSVDENKFLQKTGQKFHRMMNQYKKKGIKGRILSREGDSTFPDPTTEYRWIPEKFFNNVPYYVYADKYAVVIWEPETSVVLIENKAIAATFRKQFEAHWKEAKIPPKQS